MKGLIQTIKRLIISGLIALVLVVLGIFLFSNYLDSYTQHDLTIEVPDVYGYHISELEGFFDDKDLQYEIVDSIYNPKLDRGIVIDQSPRKTDKVKPNRKIYLTVNRLVAPRVKVPPFLDSTLRGILPKLKTIGIEVSDSVIYQPYNCDCVIGMLYKGEPIEENFEIEKGQEVTLIVGQKTNGKLPIPNLIGRKYKDIRVILLANGLMQGNLQYDGNIATQEDSANALVYKQYPIPSKTELIPIGTEMDLFFTLDSNKIKEIELYRIETIDSLKVDSSQIMKSIDSTNTNN